MRAASSPAGAFQTPRLASVRAITPATAPLGAKVSTWLSFSGLGWRSRGKNSAALALLVPSTESKPVSKSAVTSPASFQAGGGSTSCTARRRTHRASAEVTTSLSTVPSDL